MFRLVEGFKTDSKEGGRCMRGSDGKLCLQALNEMKTGKAAGPSEARKS